MNRIPGTPDGLPHAIPAATCPDATCPEAEVLAAFADGALDAAGREAVEAHLADCGDCRGTALAAATAPASAEPEFGLSDRVLARVRSGRLAPSPAAPGDLPLAGVEGNVRRSTLLSWTPFAVAAAALFAVTALLAGTWPPKGLARGESAWPASLPAASAARTASSGVPAPADLGGGERFLAHLCTDKPTYRPGERIFARAVVLNAFDRRPFAAAGVARFEVRSALGEALATASAPVVDGAAAFEWTVPDDVAGGSFSLAATFPWNGWPDAEATFDVRDFRVPRLNLDLQFERKAYGPGETATATLVATRAEGGVPVGAVASAVATVDGVEAWRGEGLALDAEGRLRVTFPLPKEIVAGDGTLAVTVADGGVAETAAKTLPLVVSRVALAFHPEGGDLVAGLPARVYFEARTPKGAPADVSGAVLDAGGAEVARFSSTHEGRGVLSFVPSAAGGPYVARIDRPEGVAAPVPLPAVATDGHSLTARQPVYGATEAVRVGVASSEDGVVTLGLHAKERTLAARSVLLRAGRPVEVSLHPREAASGVLRVTVYDATGKPRAERLVLRRPAAELRVALSVRPESADPGGRVVVDVRTTDGRGRPTAAVVGLAATDDGVLQAVDPRERAPRLPVQALLGADVAELRDAHVYLGSDETSAVRADLLLGTQGWRRFAFVDPVAFATKEGARGWRAVGGRAVPALLAYAATGGSGGAGGGFFDFTARRDIRILGEIDAAGARGVPVFKGDFDRREETTRVARRRVWVEGRAAVEELALERPRAAGPGDGALLDRELKDARKRFRISRLEMRNPGAACGGGKCGGDDAGGGARGSLWFDSTIEVAVPTWARVYAHEAAKGRPAAERTDFTETVYWAAGLATDAAGKASFTFDASDAVTTVRILADGWAKDGTLGEADATVEVRRALYVEPKFPLEVTAGDRVDLPVAVVNGTRRAVRARLVAEVGDGLRLLGDATREVAVPAKGSARVVLALEGGSRAGTAKVRLTVAAGDASDDVTREVRVVPAGFPVAWDAGGSLERRVEHEVVVPADVVAGSMSTAATAYPSPLATLSKALEALLREPGGCFEQTSSTNYPNVMVLQYLRSHQGAADDSQKAIAERAAGLLERGYRRLVGFECKGGGYEWFGRDPGHEALTAYGVLEFTDMAKVTTVDAAMLARTRAWLLARRDGKGGFGRSAASVDSFGRAPREVTDAYVTWALVESGESDLAAEAAAAAAAAREADDPYLTALAALVALRRGDAAGTALLARLAARQGADGGVDGARTSITGSGGEALRVETTSLAALAWLGSPAHAGHLERAMTWLASRCRDGRFGSTQATVLALRAIVAYDAARARPKKAGSIRLLVDGEAAAVVPFAADAEGPIALPDVGARLGAGTHRVALEMVDGSAMPYSLSVRWHAATPPSAPETKVALSAEATRAAAREGDPVDVAVVVRNVTAETLPMTVAVVGLPGGVEPRVDALKELVKEEKVDAWEVRGREVVLYWRGMAPSASRSLLLPCLAVVPGRYVGPSSRAYLYYTDEHKAWTPGLALTIEGR